MARVGEALGSKEPDAVARVDVLGSEVPPSGDRANRCVAGAGEPVAGEVEAVVPAGRMLLLRSPMYGRRREVGDVRGRQRRAEAAVEAPELPAADQAPMALGERHAGDRGAGRQARQDGADGVVADADGVASDDVFRFLRVVGAPAIGAAFLSAITSSSPLPPSP